MFVLYFFDFLSPFLHIARACLREEAFFPQLQFSPLPRHQEFALPFLSFWRLEGLGLVVVSCQLDIHVDDIL